MNIARINPVAKFVNRKKTNTPTKVNYDTLFNLKPHMTH